MSSVAWCILALSLSVMITGQVVAREVTDMAGRSVMIPERITRVFGSSPPVNVLLHAEAIELAGGYNVYRCESRDHKGMEPISIEQVLAFDPDIIVVQDPSAIRILRTDPRWQRVRAVKNNHIHAVPRWPYNWLDRPPSFMRALGAQWLANLFYPERFPLDLKRETRTFYQLFFGVSLSDAEVDELLNP